MSLLTRFDRWDPFEELDAFRNRLDRLMARMNPELPANTADWRPVADIVETKDAILVKAELPGVTEKDIHVELEANLLTISGERKEEKETEEKGVHQVERLFGRFVRAFPLPPNVKTDEIKATFADGLLEVSIPKKEESKPKEIKLQIGKKLAAA